MVKIKTIKFQINERIIELTEEEAIALKYQLDKLFNNFSPTPQSVPVYPYQPIYYSDYDDEYDLRKVYYSNRPEITC